MSQSNDKAFYDNLRHDLMILQMRIVLQQTALGMLESKASKELKKLHPQNNPQAA